MKLKLKISSILIFFILLLPLFFPIVTGDGMIHVYDPDMMYWGLQDEDQQLCAINYENGFENMLLSIDVSELSGEKAVWIFPIPAKPNETKIDIIKAFPRLHGRDVIDRADETISGVFVLMRTSQVYTFPLYLVRYAFISGMDGVGIDERITVHEHIEKMGLATELVTAEDGSAFYNYLTDKGLDLPSDSKSILDEYIGEGYTFVVSWILDVDKFMEESVIEDMYGVTSNINTVGVSITFPTDEIYFPLKPTSVYDSREIPILIYVMDHVSPKLYPEIEQNNQVNYFVQGRYSVPEELTSFFNGKTYINDLKYTKIKINAPSKYLIKDLWIEKLAPDDISLAGLVERYVWIWGAIFFILSSCLASMFSGFVTFKKDKPSMKKFALLGLLNFLTLVGIAFVSYRAKIDEKFTTYKEEAQQKKEPKRTLKEAIKLVEVWIAILILILGVLFGVVIGEIIFGFLFIAIFGGLPSLIIAPFVVYGVYRFYFYQRKIFEFIFLFTVFFLIITYVFQIAFQSIF